MQVGFIGIGRMGSGMAANLLAAGHALMVYNRSHAKAKALIRKGAQLAGTPSYAARGDVVITMLAATTPWSRSYLATTASSRPLRLAPSTSP